MKKNIIIKVIKNLIAEIIFYHLEKNKMSFSRIIHYKDFKINKVQKLIKEVWTCENLEMNKLKNRLMKSTY